ncbi:hypothetical protein MNBD_GAMMA17-877 [hydrothermal vent metagenome]|uniref:Uncharacterized protein n=1 Tax=hydrothermal vent metagenome TaxID=652676 RepID=A0A3B0ZUM0_9ZZZZ
METIIGNLIHEISDHYADYKTGEITKGQYGYGEVGKGLGDLEGNGDKI